MFLGPLLFDLTHLKFSKNSITLFFLSLSFCNYFRKNLYPIFYWPRLFKLFNSFPNHRQNLRLMWTCAWCHVFQDSSLICDSTFSLSRKSVLSKRVSISSLSIEFIYLSQLQLSSVSGWTKKGKIDFTGERGHFTNFPKIDHFFSNPKNGPNK